MFKKARIKLTALYLVIIMLVSLSFSFVIYSGINRELRRIEVAEKIRIQRLESLGFVPENEPLIPEIRARIVITLGLVNLAILGISGVAGYFLAGKTLAPIEEMHEEQKEFVSNASHELRTPLTSLKTEIEVALRDDGLTAKDARKLLKSNLEEVNKMQKMTNYLLSLNKYQKGALSLPSKKVNLEEIANKAAERVEPIAKAKKIKIIKKLGKVFLIGNQDSLYELITILLDNAIKYSTPGGKIVIRTDKKGSHSVLEIEDFGRGISQKDIPHIFDRFYRGKAPASSAYGYGLGLSIAKNIVDLHKGKIEVKSKLSKGSSFKVLI